MAQTDIPNAEQKIGSRAKDVPWYSDDIGDKLGDSARSLLENYSKIPADEVEKHAYAVRDSAWEVFPYPCIGQFRFLDVAIKQLPSYPSILPRLKTGNETFLDLGCCFAQDLRALVADGVPSENLYGSDLRAEFFEMGYKLFKDKDTLKSHFIAGDIFDPESALLKELEGKVDVIDASSFLHLFNYEEQVKVCKIMVRLLRQRKDSVIIGRQVGDLNSGQKVHKTNKGGNMFRHNEASFKKMWDEVGSETGTRWRVDAELVDIEKEAFWHSSTARRLIFAVWREE